MRTRGAAHSNLSKHRVVKSWLCRSWSWFILRFWEGLRAGGISVTVGSPGLQDPAVYSEAEAEVLHCVFLCSQPCVHWGASEQHLLWRVSVGPLNWGMPFLNYDNFSVNNISNGSFLFSLSSLLFWESNLLIQVDWGGICCLSGRFFSFWGKIYFLHVSPCLWHS